MKTVFCGDVVFDSFNKASWNEDLKAAICSNYLHDTFISINIIKKMHSIVCITVATKTKLYEFLVVMCCFFKNMHFLHHL